MAWARQCEVEKLWGPNLANCEKLQKLWRLTLSAARFFTEKPRLQCTSLVREGEGGSKPWGASASRPPCSARAENFPLYE